MLLVEDSIHAKFDELKERNESALIAYLTGGDPDLRSFTANAKALVEAGADILEVGIPFSDPISDGPVIQASSARALCQGITVDKILDAVGDISSDQKVPIVVLTYYNPVLATGVERFLSNARESGVSGVVIPDLPIEEDEEFIQIASKYGIDKICLVAPNTSMSRLERIVEKSKGFLYLVSLYGVTGPRDNLGPETLETLRKVKMVASNRIPVCAGFGVTHPEHVASLVKSGADGIIVGSALVRIVSEHLHERDRVPYYLGKAVAELKNATKHYS